MSFSSSARGCDLRFAQLSYDAAVRLALKDALVAKGLGDRIISYTPRYNAFWADRAYGSAAFRTDGEGIDVVEYCREHSAYGVDAIDYVHFMMCRRSASLRRAAVRDSSHCSIPTQMISTRKRASRARRSSTSCWSTTTP